MYSVPPHIVQKVTDYAHRKAEFYEAIFNVLDGNDRKWAEMDGI